MIQFAMIYTRGHKKFKGLYGKQAWKVWCSNGKESNNVASLVRSHCE